MEKATLKRWISKRKNKVTAIFINHNGQQLPGFSDDSFELDKEYPVDYIEEFPGGKKKNRRLLVFYEGKQIYDSRPDLAEIVDEEKSSSATEQFNPSDQAKKAPIPTAGGSSGKAQAGSGTVDGHVKPVSPKRAARAPYNFVPLNDAVFTIEREEIPHFDCYHPDRFTGCIDLEIETITPLYIRDTLNHDEASKEFEARQKNQKYDNPDFFQPNGKPQIPGSSLRGMVRTLVEIISYNKFQFFDKRKLYFRGLADQSNVRQYYNNRMTDPSLQGVAKYKVNAGYLKKEGFQYYIIPATVINEKQFRRFNGHHRLNHYEFKPLTNGNYIIRSGRKVNPRQRDKDVWEIFKPDLNAERIPLSEDDVYNYINDKTRGAKIDLIRECNFNELVPCFYVVNEAKTERSVAIGHTALFRISYLKSIDDLISNEIHLNNETVDITEAIFGKLDGEGDTFAGRVFFEDAFLKSGQEDVLMEPGNPHVLSGPKPTTFQHYLVQKDEDNRNLNHYDTDTQIRGYKLYWHKSGENWKQTDKDIVKKFPKQFTEITPVKPETRFIGRIRFENLSDVELGALLYALNLPEGCCHKLGMGKPLGLGSVRITPKLYLSERTKRYQKLFAEWNEQLAATDIEDFKTAFARKLSEQLFGKALESLWDTPRLQELRVMLDYEKGVELDESGETRYMVIQPNNEFKSRRVLPYPTQICGYEYVEQSPLTKERNFIKYVEIKGLWNNEHLNVKWNLAPDVEILHGPNGWGKTTILDLLYKVLTRKISEQDRRFKSIVIEFAHGERIEYPHKELQISEYNLPQVIFISTFDIPFEVPQKRGSLLDLVKSQLNELYDESLKKYIDRRNDVIESQEIKVADQKEEQLKQIINSFFIDSRKEIEFVQSFQISHTQLDYLKYYKVDDDKIKILIKKGIDEILINKLKEKNEQRQDYYYTEQEFTELILELIVSENINDINAVKELIFKTCKNPEGLPDEIFNAVYELSDDKHSPPESFKNKLSTKINDANITKYLKHIYEYGEIHEKDYTLFKLPDGTLIHPEELSTGEKQLLIIFFNILSLTEEDAILIMDEPEISLHIEWQERLIEAIKSLKKNMQIIIATHSPAMAINWHGQLTFVKEISKIKS